MIARARGQRGARRVAPWIAPRFLGVSLLAHAAALWAFRVFDPVTPTLAATAPPVRSATSATPEGRAFLAWVASNDPATASRMAAPAGDAVPPVAFRPSFEGTAPRPADALGSPPDLPPPTSFARPQPSSAPAPPVRPSVTRWTFGGALAARAPDGAWDPPPMDVGETLKPARFLVAADARGEIRYLFLEERSGNAAADRAAFSALLSIKLRPGEPDPAWGTATVHWGSDAYAP